LSAKQHLSDEHDHCSGNVVSLPLNTLKLLSGVLFNSCTLAYDQGFHEVERYPDPL